MSQVPAGYFEYRTATDFTPRYETRNYDLANLRALDLFVNYWGSPLIAHPILSFDFGPQGHLCFSIETRPERGKAYCRHGQLHHQHSGSARGGGPPRALGLAHVVQWLCRRDALRAPFFGGRPAFCGTQKPRPY